MVEMEKFNINELAGATGLILGGVSGLLVVIFKSRCFCKFRIGFSDNCSICMCSRSPPPDPVVENDNHDSDNEDDKTKSQKKKEDKKEDKKIEEELIPKKNDIELVEP
jgi:hypothetical protein